MILTFTELDVVARTIFGEARGEPFKGQVAVAHVIFNRVEAAKYGIGPIGVCQRKWQFSCWNANDPTHQRMLTTTLKEAALRKAADAALHAMDERPLYKLEGCTHYFADTLPSFPAWARGKTPALVIGRHLFFNDIE